MELDNSSPDLPQDADIPADSNNEPIDQTPVGRDNYQSSGILPTADRLGALDSDTPGKELEPASRVQGGALVTPREQSPRIHREPSTGQYHTVNSIAEAQDAVEVYPHIAQQRRDAMTIDGESWPTPSIADRSIIIAGKTGLSLTARESGIETLTPPFYLPARYYRKYRNREEYDAAVAAANIDNMCMAGDGSVAFAPEAGVLWVPSGDRKKDVRRVTLGTVLSAAALFIEPLFMSDGDEDDGMSDYNYSVKSGLASEAGEATGMNAFVADMVTDNAVEKAKVGRGESLEINKPMAAIGSAAVAETAKELGAHPLEVESALTRDFFSGGSEGVGMMQRALGNDRVNGLLQLTGGESATDMFGIADRFGLPGARTHLGDLFSGVFDRLYSWRQ